MCSRTCTECTLTNVIALATTSTAAAVPNTRRAKEVCVKGVDLAQIHGAAGGHQRLTGHLPAEDPNPVLLRRVATENVLFDLLQVEEVDEVFKRRSCVHVRKLKRW